MTVLTFEGLDVVYELQPLVPPFLSDLAPVDLCRILVDGFTTRLFKLHGRFDTFTYNRYMRSDALSCSALLSETIPPNSEEPLYAGNAVGFLTSHDNRYYTHRSSVPLTMFADHTEIRFVYPQPLRYSLTAFTDKRPGVIYESEIGASSSTYVNESNPPKELANYLEHESTTRELINIFKTASSQIDDQKQQTRLVFGCVEALLLWIIDDQIITKNAAMEVLTSALAAFVNEPQSVTKKNASGEPRGQYFKIRAPQLTYWKLRTHYALAGMCLDCRDYENAMEHYLRMGERADVDKFVVRGLAQKGNVRHRRALEHLLSARWNMALLFLNRADVAEATKSLQEVVAGSMDLWGNEHETTLRALSALAMVMSGKTSQEKTWPPPIIRSEFRAVSVTLPREEDISDTPLAAYLNARTKSLVRVTDHVTEIDRLRTILQSAALEKSKGDLLYLSTGIGYKEFKSSGRQLIHLLAQLGDSAVVPLSLLIKSGARINVQDFRGVTPMFLATEGAQIGVMQELLACGADASLQTKFGRSPLHQAAEMGLEEIAQLLLHAASNCNLRDVKGYTPLHLAATQGHIVIVKALLDAGADPSAVTDENRTSAHLALKNKRWDTLDLLLKKRVNLDVQDVDGHTILHGVMASGRPQLLRMLITEGAQIDLGDECGFTPLHYAASEGNLEMVSLLAASGADLEQRSKQLITPLHLASHRGHEKIVEYLLQMGVRPDLTDSDARTSLHYAAYAGSTGATESSASKNEKAFPERSEDCTGPPDEVGNSAHLEVAHILVKRVSDHDTPDVYGMTPLWIAVESGNTAITKLFLEHGADSNASLHVQKCTALHQAVSNGDTGIVHLLLDHGAIANARDDDHVTPLWLASQSGHQDIVRTLLNAGADFNTVDVGSGRTSLHQAAQNGHTGIVNLLLDHGANTNVQDIGGVTPLWLASQNGHGDVVGTLLLHEADPNIIDTDVGRAPLHQAAQNRHTGIVRLLLDHGAMVNARETNQVTPMWLASQNGNRDVVQTLLLRGADPNIQDTKHARTPLHSAARSGHLTVVQDLLNSGADVRVTDNMQRTCLWFIMRRNYWKLDDILTHPRNSYRRHFGDLSLLEALFDSVREDDVGSFNVTLPPTKLRAFTEQVVRVLLMVHTAIDFLPDE